MPREGEPASATWRDDAWRYTGAGNVWSTFSYDAELGLVYVPTSGVTNDMYGGHRLGDNLYGSSIERNAIHGSDSPENARAELAFFFSQAELLGAQ